MTLIQTIRKCLRTSPCHTIIHVKFDYQDLEHTHMSKLKIYKASAGSGKTFKLTEEYLKLIFSNETNYMSTLAVTFTNKATEEMKKRILGELYKLSTEEPSDYLPILCSELNLDEMQVAAKAKHLLEKILHNYSRFSIDTIDSFFQKVVRSFAKELGIYESINLELDNSAVLDDATDELILNIDAHPELKTWLIQFIDSRIKDNKSWKIKTEIHNLGQELFKEEFRSESELFLKRLNDKTFLNKYLSTLKTTITNFDNHLKKLGTEGLEMIKSHGLEISDFKGGKNSFIKFFANIKTGNYNITQTTRKAIDEPDNWQTKTSNKRDQIQTAFHAGLNKLLASTIQYIDEEGLLYNSAIELTRYFHTLGILGDIARSIKELTNDKGIFLLSETTRLLNEMIKETDAPFIYEKIGHRYKHILIDEFQDTSKIQWENFKPLLNNSLSENQLSLVVGDVKQSIYRWRNGDWKILASDIYKEFNHYGISSNSLATNYRSKKNVVLFNNSIFTAIPSILYDQLQELTGNDALLNDLCNDFKGAFSDAIQSTPEKISAEKAGYINVNLVESTDEQEWKDQVLDGLPKLIMKLQDKGFKASEIAFLTRTSREGNMIANFLLDYKSLQQPDSRYSFDFISNDTLFLSSSDKIRLIIAVLAYFNNKQDYIARAEILQFVHQNSTAHTDGFQLFDIAKSDQQFPEHLPDGFDKLIEALHKRSIFENIERIIAFFNLHESPDGLVFLETFQDWVLDVSSKKNLDIAKFLRQWDEKGKNVKISLPSGQEAMQILTIHKSKGIEFEIVIIPFCDWNIDHDAFQTNVLWCKTDISPFDELELLPVKYSSKLENTIFIKDYLAEKIKSYVDNLNLLYVSCTRARNGLFIYGPQKSRVKTSVSNLLAASFTYPMGDSNPDLIKLSECYQQEAYTFELGSLSKDNHSITESIQSISQEYLVNPFNVKDAFKSTSSGMLGLQGKVQDQQNYGNFMHELFAQIEKRSDIETAIQNVRFEGLITEEKAIALLAEIKQKMTHPIVSEWFDGSWLTKTEDEILIPPSQVKIPDRVMLQPDKAIVIDYKFGEKKSKSYEKQVSEYKKLLSTMGYDNVVGYIWYYELEEVVKV